MRGLNHFGSLVVPALVLLASFNAAAQGSPGEMPVGNMVFPADRATGVVLNPSLLLRVPGAGLRRGSDPIFPLGEGLALRAAGGDVLSAGPLQTRQLDAVCVAECEPGDIALEIASGPLELAPSTRYEVLSRVTTCGEADVGAKACLGAAFHAIAKFETGSMRDDEPPQINEVTAELVGPCRSRLTVEFSDAYATPESIRFALDGDEAPHFGDPFIIVGPEQRFEDEATLSLAPVDPSGNQGPFVTTVVTACHSPIEYDDILGPPAVSQAAEGGDAPSSRHASFSCTIGAGAPGRAEQRELIGPTGAIALACLARTLRRRMRATSGRSQRMRRWSCRLAPPRLAQP